MGEPFDLGGKVTIDFSDLDLASAKIEEVKATAAAATGGGAPSVGAPSGGFTPDYLARQKELGRVQSETMRNAARLQAVTQTPMRAVVTVDTAQVKQARAEVGNLYEQVMEISNWSPSAPSGGKVSKSQFKAQLRERQADLAQALAVGKLSSEEATAQFSSLKQEAMSTLYPPPKAAASVGPSGPEGPDGPAGGPRGRGLRSMLREGGLYRYARALAPMGAAYAGVRGLQGVARNQLEYERNQQMEGFNARTIGADWAGQAAGIHEGSGSTMAEIQGAAQGVTGFTKGLGVGTAEMVAMGARVADMNPMLAKATDAVNAMQQAATGNAGAAGQLGVDLTDTYMATKAFGGQLKTTWATLDETQKAQMRYNEMLLQLSSQDGGVGAATRASKDFSKGLEDAKIALGTALAPTMEGLATGMAGWAEGVQIMTSWIKEKAGEEKPPATAAEAYGRDSYANVRMFGIDLPGLIDPFEPRPTIVDTPATTKRLATEGLATAAAAQAKADAAAIAVANAANAAAVQQNSITVGLTLQGMPAGYGYSVGTTPAAIQ